ncbi:HAD family phosphatase [Kiritimatiellota bacterium B12222]|nr:HAD family phosphatase [Kiritimatiellota bacterium B12222]
MEKFTHKLESVIFDMDGTLIDTERIGAASWDHAGEETGLFVSEEVKRRMVGRNMQDITAMVQADLPEQDVTLLLERANFHYHRLVTEKPPPIKPGARALLEWLLGQGVPMALATSSRIAQAHDKLARTGLDHFFTFMIAGDQIDRGKPEPEIFERAAEGLGCEITRSAVFEDSAPGIEAAQRAGAYAVLVPEFFPVDPGMAMFADEILKDLTEAQALLASRF